MKILKNDLESLMLAEIVNLEGEARKFSDMSAKKYLRADKLRKECGIPMPKEWKNNDEKNNE